MLKAKQVFQLEHNKMKIEEKNNRTKMHEMMKYSGVNQRKVKTEADGKFSHS